MIDYQKMSPLVWLFAALYVSQVWYAGWEENPRRISYKARGIVVFDRVLNGELQ